MTAKRRTRASTELGLVTSARDSVLRQLEEARAELRLRLQAVSGLTAEVSKLKNAIKKHRDSTESREWGRPADIELYGHLGETIALQPIPTGPDGRRRFLLACDIYWHRVTGTPHTTESMRAFYPELERIVDALAHVDRTFRENDEDRNIVVTCMLAVAGQARQLSEIATDLRRIETQEKERTRPLDGGGAVVIGYTEE